MGSGENLEFFKFEYSMECYETVNKGRICTDLLSSEYPKVVSDLKKCKNRWISMENKRLKV